MPYSVGSVYQRAGGDRTKSRSRSRLLGLFGVLFAAAGWRGIWASSWSYERVAALVMFVVGNHYGWGGYGKRHQFSAPTVNNHRRASAIPMTAPRCRKCNAPLAPESGPAARSVFPAAPIAAHEVRSAIARFGFSSQRASLCFSYLGS